MGLFNKKSKSEDSKPSNSESQKSKSRQKSDKDIKPKAPKNMVGKKVLRSVFWIFMSFLLLKGAIAFAQGNRPIHQTIINGNTGNSISESVKGFAVNFATEYFTWNADYVADRSSRINKFIKGINSEMGMDHFSVKGSSKVTSVEVFDAAQIDSDHVDVSLIVWREVLPLPNQLEAAKGDSPAPVAIHKKTYMVVPVTLAKEGPVIEAYPRFVSEPLRGDTIDKSGKGVSVGDGGILQKGKDLADSYLKTWYEGNASQLKYFYADTVKAPVKLQKSDYTYEKLDNVSIYQNAGELGDNKTYRIEAVVIVKDDLGEKYLNSWTLQVNEKDGGLYVLSNGLPTKEQFIPEITPETLSDSVPNTSGKEDNESLTDPSVDSNMEVENPAEGDPLESDSSFSDSVNQQDQTTNASN